MIKSKKEQSICQKYSSRDADGKVHCSECPLRKSKGNYDFRCKANSSYNKRTKEWEYDHSAMAQMEE